MAPRRCIPLYETVEAFIDTALGRPGLMHITTHVKLCQGDEKTSAKIDFRAGGTDMNIALFVCADNSFFLSDHGRTVAQWTAEEAQPSLITETVIGAIRQKVAA